MFLSLNRTILLVPALAAGSLYLSACDDSCASATDCQSNEVCYAEVCTPALARDTLCNGDLDCDPSGSQTLRCVSGICVVDPTNVAPPACPTPVCFERGTVMPGALQTMTATTGTIPDDQEAPMTGVIAITQPGNNIVNIIGRNPNTDRYICVSINTTGDTCDLMQVSVGDPAVGTPTIFETTACNATLTNTIGSVEGEVRGTVQNCMGDAFEAYAGFEVTRQ